MQARQRLLASAICGGGGRIIFDVPGAVYSRDSDCQPAQVLVYWTDVLPESPREH